MTTKARLRKVKDARSICDDDFRTSSMTLQNVGALSLELHRQTT